MRTNKRVGAVVIRDNKILLIHRFKNGSEYWVLPGGGVESEETVEEGLVREVKEETGLDLQKYELLGENEFGDIHHIFYKCELAEGTPEIGGPEKENSSEQNVYILEWVPVKAMLDLENFFPSQVKEYLR
jgi:8-oxo-dGTP pyrophosphatase MutT (NUDIX family)